MEKKKILAICTLLILVVGIIFITFPNHNNKTVSKSNNDNLIRLDDSAISLMIETTVGSGEYELSSMNTWPTTGYVFNEKLSYCENGSKLIYDETNGLQLKTTLSDKCYIYYDIVPDLSIATAYNGYAEVPRAVGPSASLSCTGATAAYNNQYNRVEVSGISTQKATCNLNYTDRTSKTYLNNKIIGLSGTTQGTGQVVQEKGYRYEGKNPNNYIWFNNELWRIIGVFDSTSHGVSGQNLTKIIRDEPIGNLTYCKNFSNNWSSTSCLKYLLNSLPDSTSSGAYYNKTNGTNSGYCYGYYGVTSICDYSIIGIDALYRSMIKNVTWYLGGLSSASGDANYYQTNVDNIFTYERGTTVYSGRPTSDTGHIGLIYPSDFGYAVLPENCARTTNVVNYTSSSCSTENWLVQSGWTITPDSSKTDRAFVNFSNVGYTLSYYSRKIKPTLYLDSSVYVISGTGTIIDPYIIGM